MKSAHRRLERDKKCQKVDSEEWKKKTCCINSLSEIRIRKETFNEYQCDLIMIMHFLWPVPVFFLFNNEDTSIPVPFQFYY